MTLRESDVTVVFQGAVIPGTGGTAEHIRRTQRVLPHAHYVLSTWKGSDCRGIDVDDLILSDDPGGLPGIKRRDGEKEPNNVNRQLRSTRRGLDVVETPYAIKLRADCSLEHAGVLRETERFLHLPRRRIVASSIFTIDPFLFEQMPYHVSDWFQVGETAALQAYWSAPFMDRDDATHYERTPYAAHSTFLDRRFRCRLAVEQYVACHYAALLDYPLPQYHNDMRSEVLAGHRRFLAERFVIFDPWRIGLRFPKYAWTYQSSFQNLNCLLFLDWYQLYLEEGGAPIDNRVPLRLFRLRRRRKRLARLLGRCVDRAGPLLVRPACKSVVNRFLSLLAGGRPMIERR